MAEDERRRNAMATVYILGAGATKAATQHAPMTDDLLGKAFEYLKDDQRVRKVMDFVGDFYLGLGHDQMAATQHFAAKDLPRIEDVLSLLDAAMASNEPLSSKYDVAYLRGLRFDLTYLIYGVLQHSLDVVSDSYSPVYEGFVRALSNGDSVISLNYDIAVDNALLERLYETAQASVDYGLRVRYSYQAGKYGERLGPVPLLKLHGSLNWLYCPECNALDVTEGHKGVYVVFKKGEGCKCMECQKASYEAILITPSFVRSSANGLLVSVWKRAEQAVAKAERLVFIGYSLPDADVDLRSMLTKGLYNNAKRNAVPICVIDRERQPGTGEPPDEWRRYRQFFGERVQYYPIGFQRFVKGGLRCPQN
jgi:hypothetical protein